MKRKAGRGHGLARGPQCHGLAHRARAPARPAAAGPAPVPSASGSRRTGPAPLGGSFIYALLSTGMGMCCEKMMMIG